MGGLPSPPPSDETAPSSSPTPSVQFDSDGVLTRYKLVRAKIRQVRVCPINASTPSLYHLTYFCGLCAPIHISSSGRRSMFNSGIFSGWRAVVSCTEIRSTHPVVSIRGMERSPSSPGIRVGTDPVACIVTNQLHTFKQFHFVPVSKVGITYERLLRYLRRTRQTESWQTVLLLSWRWRKRRKRAEIRRSELRKSKEKKEADRRE